MDTRREELKTEIILYMIEHARNLIYPSSYDGINVSDIRNDLERNHITDYGFEKRFKEAILSLISQGILIDGAEFYLGGLYTGIRNRTFSSILQIDLTRKLPTKVFIDKDKIKEKLNEESLSSAIKTIYIEKENEAKIKIESDLEELKNMIKNKKGERELHNYIKEKKLIPTPFIQHEFQSLVQNRQDFLIKNEFGEFEIWELKPPSVKLFEGEIPEDVPEKYKKLKLIVKSSDLVTAIEQLSIYKKEFIDGNVTHPNLNENLKENIYNAKLVLVIGSNDELISEIYLEKLNLERYMLNNLNIITWEMFYDKIESYYKQLIEN